MWGHFKDGILLACDELCGMKRGRSNGDTWFWNEEVKESVSRNKDAHKEMCQNSYGDNKRRCKSYEED